MKAYYKIITFAILCILVIILSFWAKTVTAQEGGTVQWDEPVNVSKSDTVSVFPSLVSDKYGFIHVFWGEELGGPPVDPENATQNSNSIMYARGDGQTWSEPVDIFFGDYNFPQADIDQENILHLTFRNLKGVFYSSAPALQAYNAQSWQPAQLLAPARALEAARIRVDQEGGLHVVFSGWVDTEFEEKDGNVYYIHSLDKGDSWSDPIRLSEVVSGDANLAAEPRIAIDNQNWLHVVWQDSQPPSFVGSGVLYVRSEDGGITWSAPVDIARPVGEEKWGAAPEIVALSSGELLIVWVCGDLPHRCYRRSFNGGIEWSPTTQVFGNLHSLAGWDTLTVTDDGTLYWVAQLRYPYALYYSWWMGERWAAPQIITQGYLNEGHYVGVTSSLGNQLDLVTVHQSEKEIWYFKGITSSQLVKPIPTPTSKPTVIETPTPKPKALTLLPTVTPPAKLNVSDLSIVDKEYSPNYPIAVAIIPVLGLIIVAGLIKFFNRGY